MVCYLIISLLYTIYHANTQFINCRGNCACPSSQTGTTCILNCDGQDQCKDSALICRYGDPCQVNCNGDNSCEGNGFIDGSGATDVTVNCIGNNACKGNTIINCGTASCSISCESRTSCDGTSINAKDATSLQCTGGCGPSIHPFHVPTTHPTLSPTNIPTLNPSYTPSDDPTRLPTRNPTVSPTHHPTTEPTIMPTIDPTINPTIYPTNAPIITLNPTMTWTESADSFEVNVMRNNGQISESTMYHLFIASTVIIITSSILCCCGIFVYYSAKKTDVSEEISVAIDRLSNPNPGINRFNFPVNTVNGVNGDKQNESVHKMEVDDVKNDEIMTPNKVYKTKKGNNDDESDASLSSAGLTSCSLSSTLRETLKKMTEGDGKKDIQTVDDGRYTWCGYNEAQAVCGMHMPQYFDPYRNNNIIST